MGSKYRYVLSILQIVVGILAAMVFIKTIVYGGKVELKLISLMAMILGVLITMIIATHDDRLS